MSRLQSVRRRRPLGLTSLIDVIFLLLLFFMLSSTFTRFGDMPFLAAGGGTGASPAGSPPAFLRVLPDRVILNTTEVTLDDLSAALGRVDAETVLVSPAEGVTAQRLVDVLFAARKAEGINLRLIGG